MKDILINLTNELDKASKLYYEGKESSLSDTEFDLKMKQLQKLEKELGIVLPNSPTQRVGSDIQKEFKKINHPSPMLTIENVYDENELKDWFFKMKKEYDAEEFDVSVKYDGISCEIHYVNGKFVSAATRGDKNIGDDITENVKTIMSVPLEIDNTIEEGLDDVYVRGEILMTKSMLERINNGLASEGKKLFANCRNACAGSVKQLDPKITASRHLIFRAWDILAKNKAFYSQNSKSNILSKFGFIYEDNTVPFVIKTSTNVDLAIETVNRFYETLKDSNLDYDFDGVVIKINNTTLQEEIGTKDDRSIEWGIARKWNEDKEVITRLEGVEFQVGRTGNITPVGKLYPVPCDGVIISNVILNNEQYIKDLDIQINKPIKIVRSGSVIPKAIGSATEEEYCKFTYGEDNRWPMNGYVYYDIMFPETCPICGSKIEKVGEIWKCVNDECPAKIEGNLLQWCSKICMDIENVGPSVVKDLIEKVSINTPLDLYFMAEKMTPNEVLYRLGEGYGIKSIKSLFKNINKSKDKPFETILFGMGIPGIGKKNAHNIAKDMKTLDNIIQSSVSDLMNIDGIGMSLADDIHEWMRKNGEEWLDKLNELKMATSYETGFDIVDKEQLLEGLNIVFTGKSKYWEGDDVEVVLSSYGAKCGHGVSKKVNYLITGEKPGPSKVSKAREIGVDIITEDDFLNKFNIPVEVKVTKEKPMKTEDIKYSQEELF